MRNFSYPWGRMSDVWHRWVGLVSAGWLLFALGCGGPEPDPPHILLVSIDTLARSALRVYNDDAPRLPAIDALAEESIRFESALSTASWTLPAQASLLTGLYPDRHGATDPRVGISAATVPLAEMLREQGYETVAFTDGGFMSADYGLARGFDRYDKRAPEGGAVAELTLPRDGAPDPNRGVEPFDRAVAYLEARGAAASPFFLFLQTYNVHDYYMVRPWATVQIRLFEDLSPHAYLECLKGRRACRPRHFRRLAALYRAELVHLDRAFGRLLDVLDATGVADRTVIAFVSDHGEAFQPKRGRLHHGGRLHADQIRIPFFLRIPGERARSIAAPVSLVDVMPTLLGLTGVAPPADLDGTSLMPLVEGAVLREPRTLFAMEHYWRWEYGVLRAEEEPRDRASMVAAIDPEWWLIDVGAGEEFYAFADVDHTNDLTGQGGFGDSVDRLRRAREQRSRERPPTAPVPVDGALREQLRALGYVE